MIATGVLAADGFGVPELSDRLQAQLRDLRPGAASTRNPVDLTAVIGRPQHVPAGARRGDRAAARWTRRCWSGASAR